MAKHVEFDPLTTECRALITCSTLPAAHLPWRRMALLNSLSFGAVQAKIECGIFRV